MMNRWFQALISGLVALVGSTFIALYFFDAYELTRTERLSVMEVVVGLAGSIGTIAGLFYAAYEFHKSTRRPVPTVAFSSKPARLGDGTDAMFLQWVLNLVIGNTGNEPLLWYSVTVEFRSSRSEDVLDIQRLGPTHPEMQAGHWSWLDREGMVTRLPVRTRFTSDGALAILDAEGEVIAGPTIRLDKIDGVLTIHATVRTAGIDPIHASWEYIKDGELTPA